MQQKIVGAFLSLLSLKRQSIFCEPSQLYMLYGLFVRLLWCFKSPQGIRKFDVSDKALS